MINKDSLYYKIYYQAKPYMNWFVFAFILSIIISILGPARPYILQHIIDEDIKHNNMVGLWKSCALMFGLLIVESLLRYLFIFYTSSFSQNIVHDLRRKIFDHLINIHVQFFDKTPIGTLTTRTINDVETINEVYSENFFTIVSDILTIVFVLSIMIYTDFKLTLVSLVTLPFLYFATYVFKEKIKVVNQKIRDKIGELNAFTQEHIVGIRLTKAFVAEEKEYKRFESINKDYTDLNIKTIWYYSWFFPVLETLVAISVGLVVSYVAYYGFNDRSVQVGVISSFILYINMLFRPMRFIADKFNQLQMGFIASERVFKIIETPSQETNQGVFSPKNVEGNIRFDNVKFSYLDDVPVLKGVSFEIEKGKSLAIVGSTGSGKTSIINILNRFYPIQSGQVSIDGVSIEEFDIHNLRSHIAMVLQDVYLFSGTIMDNITLLDSGISEEYIINMAKELDVHEFFERLPNGYHYEIKERGNSLSHGQKQVISFFRAIVKNPSILILDEATSSIDSNTEYYIQKLIPKIIKNKTSIIIAHRLSTIMEADKILVLDKGIIVGEGTHESLLASNVYYQKYFKEVEKQ